MGKGNCNSCHLDGTTTKLKPGQTDTGTPADAQPWFTGNPYGFGYRDLGFGAFLRSGFGSAPNPNSSNWLSFAPTSDGHMQTSTVRNVAMTPPKCPTTEAGQKDASG